MHNSLLTVTITKQHVIESQEIWQFDSAGGTSNFSIGKNELINLDLLITKCKYLTSANF